METRERGRFTIFPTRGTFEFGGSLGSLIADEYLDFRLSASPMTSTTTNFYPSTEMTMTARKLSIRAQRRVAGENPSVDSYTAVICTSFR